MIEHMKKREELQNEIDSLRVVRKKDALDSQVDIPYHARIQGSKVFLYTNEESEQSLIDTFSSIENAIIVGAVEKVSIARAVLLSRMSSTSAKVADLYTLLSNSDGLLREVQESEQTGKLTEKDSSFVLGALLNDEVTNDISRVNGLRWFSNVALSQEVGELVHHGAIESLSEVLASGRERYNQVAKMFGMHCPYERSRYFSGSIQEMVLGFAFPMGDVEADIALEHV